jgi:DNA-binding response OmpR family regulator
MSEKILIVEDEPTLSETLAYNLQKQGYEVSIAPDGWSAIKKARSESPDLVVLDIMLPGIDGIEVCKIIRQESNVPILMLTARADEVDKVVGLEVGADDYMTKPFSLREFMARVRALLRRVRLMKQPPESPETPYNEEQIVLGDLMVDPVRHSAFLRGEEIQLKPKEFDLLLYFVRHKGIALSRDKILEQVWGWDYAGESRTVDVHVRWLREKIEADPRHPVRLVTVRGVGYRFEG